MYYLQSRYYDPKICRFINADSFASTGQGPLGYNMFAYCLNNPVCRKDFSGTTSVDVFDSDGDLLSEEKEFGGSGSNGDSPARGIGGKGWYGDATWRGNIRTVGAGGDVRGLNGGIPTVTEAQLLIVEAGGAVGAYHDAHPVGGISTHTYNHIHYVTSSGIRSTIEVVSKD